MEILPSSYLAPILQFCICMKEKEIMLEVHENYKKQTYRNRTYIYGANGALMLNIPLEKGRNHTAMKDKKISYEADWRQLHWRSFESAYRSSPFFEYFEDDLRPFYEGKEVSFLVDFNEKLEEKIKELLSVQYTKKPTEHYMELPAEEDWRVKIHPKKHGWEQQVEFPEYLQVFADRFGFIQNLSIVDLLFNEGPNARKYLEKIQF